MDRISIAKTLLKYIGRDSIENDWAIAQGVLIVLDGATVQEPVQETRQVPKTTPPMDDKAAPKKPKKTEQKRFDTGKLRALRNGGWPIAKIADEMGVSDQTIRNHMKKEGIA